MIILNVFLTIKPEKETDFTLFAKELTTKSRAENGNSLYNFYKQTDGSNKYVIVEHWENAAAIDAHNGTAHFQKFIAEINEYISEPLDLQKYEK